MASFFKHNGKPVTINFALYNATNDNQFKLELLSLMISNIMELKNAAVASLDSKNSVLFDKMVHKAKATMGLLNDKDFSDAIQQLKDELNQNPSTPDVKKLMVLEEVCESIIHSLKEESRVLQSL